MGTAGEEANQRLVDQLIARGALWSQPLIEAFRATPRHRFLQRVWHYQEQNGGWREVPTQVPGRQELRLLYADRALTTRLSEPAPGLPPMPISSSSQPSLMAEMLEDLRLEPGLKTLEIGAGTGYNAALLSHVVGRVISLEIDRRVLAEAEESLRAFPDRRVELRHGDGRLGCPEAAPFDRILITAAALDLEPAWLEQLSADGLLLVPLDLAPGLAFLVRGTCRGGVFDGRLTRPAYFMPLRDEMEGGRGNSSLSSRLLPVADTLPSVTAPWADWTGRKTPGAGPGLLPSLAFLGWLHGFTIGCQTLADGRTYYGIGDLVKGHACWLGLREWRVTGMAGRNLGLLLWRDFLDAGGPWPTEFRLRAVPADTPNAEITEEPADSLLVFHRQGPRCRQMWTLEVRRQRPAWS
ncbi:MAG TPA: rRNA adenine N-6-methyltransferase family protein [Gemmataceae bacterium]|nr:rRNA adenine N-6-methyltransferase family protein [Gemmataceae bacterium]